MIVPHRIRGVLLDAPIIVSKRLFVLTQHGMAKATIVVAREQVRMATLYSLRVRLNGFYKLLAQSQRLGVLNVAMLI